MAMYRVLIAGVFATALFTNALAVDVLLVRTSTYNNADAIAAVLTAGGHNVTIVDDIGSGITIPDNTQVIFLQGYVYPATTSQVVNWLYQRAGRGLVTTEWVVWYAHYGALSAVLPVTTNASYAYPSFVTYSQVTADPLMNANLPASFSFSSSTGGVTRFAAKQGATVFYAESTFPEGVGVAGWELSNGSRVVSINAVAQDGDSLNSPEFRQLLVNAVTWAAAGREPCRLEGDVNGDNVVNNADLLIVLFNFGRSCP